MGNCIVTAFMDTTLLIFILLFGLLQGILMTVVLLARKKINHFHFYLCGYIIVLLFQLAFKIISKPWIMQHFRQPYLLSYYLPFLYGPFIFLFAKNYLRHSDARPWKSIFHFIPFLICISMSAANELNLPALLYFVAHPVGRSILEMTSIVIYHAHVFFILKQEKENGRLNLQFLRRFLFVSISTTTIISITLYFLYVLFPTHQDIRWIFASLTAFIYWLSFEALKKPELFHVILGNAKSSGNEYSIPVLKVHYAKEKYAHSSLKEEECKRILHLLEKVMDQEKLYLDPSTNIDSISTKISCRKHHLSQVLNDKMKKSFNDWLNEKRIQESKLMLANPSFNHFKISSVAFDTGFKSLSSFNEIFKKREGITPSQFRATSQEPNKSQVSRI